MAHAAGVLNGEDRITDFELTVLRRIAQGKSLRVIADEIFGDQDRYGTIAGATNRLREKMNAANKYHLIKRGIDLRLLDPWEGDPPLPPWVD